MTTEINKKDLYDIIRGCCISDESATEATKRILKAINKSIASNQCEWKEDNCGYGSPINCLNPYNEKFNEIKFCPFCGKRIKIIKGEKK